MYLVGADAAFAQEQEDIKDRLARTYGMFSIFFKN